MLRFGRKTDLSMREKHAAARHVGILSKTRREELLQEQEKAIQKELDKKKPVDKKNPWGVNQYSGFSKPKKSFGSHLFGSKKKSYGYKTPGYGTNWGTNFAGGMGQYKKPKKGISKKGRL